MSRSLFAVAFVSLPVAGALGQLTLVEDLRSLEASADIELTDPDDGVTSMFFGETDQAFPTTAHAPFNDVAFATALANPLDWCDSSCWQDSTVTPTLFRGRGGVFSEGRFDFVVPPALMFTGGISRYEIVFEVTDLTLVRVQAELVSGSPTQHEGTYGAALTQTSRVVDDVPSIEVVTYAQAVEIQDLLVDELVRLEPGVYKQLFLAQAGVGATMMDDPEDSSARFEAELALVGTMCNEADYAEPFGQLDFSDVVTFLIAFSGGQQAADLAEPFGAFDFSDVVIFLERFGAGCP